MNRQRSVVGMAIVMFCGGLTVANTQGIEAQQYEQLRQHLFAGDRVTAIFTPHQCKPTGAAAKTTPTSSGGLTIQNFMEIGGNTIAFANRHLTLRSDGEAVLELVQYRVHATGAATVKVSFLSPTTYKPMQEARTFECQLGSGLDFRHANSSQLR